jgi:hypothetical protein
MRHSSKKRLKSNDHESTQKKSIYEFIDLSHLNPHEKQYAGYQILPCFFSRDSNHHESNEKNDRIMNTQFYDEFNSEFNKQNPYIIAIKSDLDVGNVPPQDVTRYIAMLRESNSYVVEVCFDKDSDFFKSYVSKAFSDQKNEFNELPYKRHKSEHNKIKHQIDIIIDEDSVYMSSRIANFDRYTLYDIKILCVYNLDEEDIDQNSKIIIGDRIKAALMTLVAYNDNHETVEINSPLNFIFPIILSVIPDVFEVIDQLSIVYYDEICNSDLYDSVKDAINRVAIKHLKMDMCHNFHAILSDQNININITSKIFEECECYDTSANPSVLSYASEYSVSGDSDS